jgi:hypothetical protein
VDGDIGTCPGTLALSAINMQGKACTSAAHAAGFPAGPWE